MDSGLAILLLEAALALALLLAIVWWTWPKSRPDRSAPPAAGADTGSAAGQGARPPDEGDPPR